MSCDNVGEELCEKLDECGVDFSVLEVNNVSECKEHYAEADDLGSWGTCMNYTVNCEEFAECIYARPLR